MKFPILIVGGIFSFAIQAVASPIMHDSTPSETEYAKKINNELRQLGASKSEPKAHLPVEDDADFSYVLVSAEENGTSEARELRRLIASNLPENVKLVVLTTTSNAATIRSRYAAWINPSRLIIASDSSSTNSNGFWARDSFPIPVRDLKTNGVSLIAHQYYRSFNSFAAIANSVSAKYESRGEVFVGGNLIADREGHCFSVDSTRLFDMNADEIQNIYGCKSIHLLSHEAGIGDVDEVLKPLSNKVMLTNQPAYESQLRSLGYNVVKLPNLAGTYRTYANALMVGKTAFMPTFGIVQDQQAQAVYESLGYKVVPIRTNYLSDQLHGSIHCQTMAYPAIAKETLLKELGLEEVLED